MQPQEIQGKAQPQKEIRRSRDLQRQGKNTEKYTKKTSVQGYTYKNENTLHLSDGFSGGHLRLYWGFFLAGSISGQLFPAEKMPNCPSECPRSSGSAGSLLPCHGDTPERLRSAPMTPGGMTL